MQSRAHKSVSMYQGTAESKTRDCGHARIGLGDERNAMSAFLFTFPSGNTSGPAEKLPKVLLSF